MKPQHAPPAARTAAAGNTEKRDAQIQHIKERLDRVRGNFKYVAAELAALTQEINNLSGSEEMGEPAVPARRDH